MKHPDEAQRSSCQEDVVHAAQGLISGSIPFLAGVRKLVALRFEVSELEHDPDFTIFVAIDSQADHLPPDDVRSLCAQAWLEKCDQDARELEEVYRKPVLSACVNLLQRFASRL